MAELSYFWDGTLNGDASLAPYDAPTTFSEFVAASTGLLGLPNQGGVLPGVLNQLAPAISTSNIQIDTGAAMVEGSYYKNTAAKLVPIPTPISATRIDLIVLAKSWLLANTRLTRLIGGEGSGTAPALTQVIGNEWDFPLCQISITTGGVITLFDARGFMSFDGKKTGDVISSFRSAAPPGYLAMTGQTIDATQPLYTALYSWANGEGYIGSGAAFLFSGTQSALVCRDMRGMALAVSDAMGGSARNLLPVLSKAGAEALGAGVGEITHTLIAAEIGSHTHTTPIAVGDGPTPWTGANTNLPSATASTGTGNLNYVSDGGTGGGGAHNNVQPTIALNVFIKL